MDAYAKSKTPEGEGDKRQTPIAVFNRIQQLINIPIVHDVAAEPHTAKCASYWTAEDDSFIKDWLEPLTGPSLITALWMNPVYSNPAPWCQRAYETAQRGGIVVGLLPDDRSVSWYQDWIEDKAAIIYVPDKRISFEDGEGVAQKGNPKGSVIPVWLPMHFDKTNYVRFKLCI